MSKGLQAAFALAQGAHNMAFLKVKLTNDPTSKKIQNLWKVLWQAQNAKVGTPFAGILSTHWFNS